MDGNSGRRAADERNIHKRALGTPATRRTPSPRYYATCVPKNVVLRTATAVGPLPRGNHYRNNLLLEILGRRTRLCNRQRAQLVARTTIDNIRSDDTTRPSAIDVFERAPVTMRLRDAVAKAAVDVFASVRVVRSRSTSSPCTTDSRKTADTRTRLVCGGPRSSTGSVVVGRPVIVTVSGVP